MTSNIPSKNEVWTWVAKGEDHCCWPWVGTLYAGGYGRYKNTTAHRAVWASLYGEPHPDLEICHTCDNRRCCNPKHLFAGTPQVNALDKKRKGRVARILGARNGQSKLSAEDVAAIRASPLSSRELAKELGISHSNVRMIRTRRTWDHG